MQKFDTPAPITAVLDVPAGRIQLIAADRANTTVEVLPADAAKDRDVTAARQTTVEYADGVLRVTTPLKPQILGASGTVEVSIQLPSGSRLKAKAAAAELRGVGRLGEVSYDGSQAEIKLDEVAGAHLATSAGSVAIGRLTGPAYVTTMQGDIRIAEAVRGALELRTQDGDITIGAAAGVSATLDAGTSMGRIRNALTNTGGTADLEIQATTTRGDIDARSL
ncbi:DUF4097 family beta strand repeat-containing protein [Micromonospora sp. NPDC023633]|uniref:DUF4097 family beta strand repeat-containing protein n=1 Tax=Micromonospora sp. NPDC023633 TaxID=3154320 RepID=UPI0033D57A61